MKRSKERLAVGAGNPDFGESGRKHILPVLFIAVSIFLAYSDSLHGTWALDDVAVGQFRSIGSVLGARTGYRVVAYLSFVFNQWINPLDPLNYRLTNIVIHIVNSVLVYFLAFMTLRLPAWKERLGEYSFPVALLSSVAFALHPININAVAYIVQRMASLAAMFVLLALISYIFARIAKNTAVSAVLYIASILFVTLGIFSKENAVMAVPLVLLYEYVFLAGPEKKSSLKRLSVGLFAGLVLLAGLSFFFGFQAALSRLLVLFMHPNAPIPDGSWTAVDVYWTPAQHILTEFRVIGRYLILLLAPLPRFFVFDWWGFPLSKSILDPASTLVSALTIAALLGVAVYKMKKIPFLSFGILWYFVAISLESFVAVGSDLYFEHRNYLPLAGLIIGATAQTVTLFRPDALKERRVWVVALLLSAILGALTYQRNLVWKDSVTLWQDTVRKAPENLRARIALGNSYLKESDPEPAVLCYEKAMKMSESSRRVQFFQDSSYSLGMVYLFMGDFQRAKRVLNDMESEISGSIRTDILKGFYDSLNGDTDEAIREFYAVLPRASGIDRVIVHTLLGDAYRNKGLPAKALESYKEALQVDPSFSAAYYGMGSVYLAMGRLDEASSFMQKTLAIDPDNALALSDAADIVMIKKGPLDRAISLAGRAIAKSPPFSQPYATMGNVLIVAGKEQEADDFYRQAVKRGMKEYMVLFVKARAYYIKGDHARAEVYLRELAAMKDLPENLRRVVDASLKKM
jgi:protein O-mannosyl-transferase